MKILTKEHLKEIIDVNFFDGEDIAYEDLKVIFERLGDDYFIVDGVWQLTKKADVSWRN